MEDRKVSNGGRGAEEWGAWLCADDVMPASNSDRGGGVGYVEESTALLPVSRALLMAIGQCCCGQGAGAEPGYSACGTGLACWLQEGRKCAPGQPWSVGLL